MNLYTADYIVRNNLLRHGYPLHWYMQSLIYCCEIIQELTLDDLKIVNTRIIPVNAYSAADLPEDFDESVGVFIKAGQKLQPLIEDSSINPLNNFDSDFAIQKWDSPTTQQPNDQSVVQISGLLNTFWFGFSAYDSLGEPTGRFAGIGNPTNKTYKIIKQRNQVQLNQNLSVDEIVIQYISNGRSVDSISSIESYALETIRNYIDYRLKDFNRTYSRGEVDEAKQDYFNARKKFRSRKSDLTVTTLRQIILKNQRLSVKG